MVGLANFSFKESGHFILPPACPVPLPPQLCTFAATWLSSTAMSPPVFPMPTTRTRFPRKASASLYSWLWRYRPLKWVSMPGQRAGSVSYHQTHLLQPRARPQTHCSPPLLATNHCKAHRGLSSFSSGDAFTLSHPPVQPHRGPALQILVQEHRRIFTRCFHPFLGMPTSLSVRVTQTLAGGHRGAEGQLQPTPLQGQGSPGKEAKGRWGTW